MAPVIKELHTCPTFDVRLLLSGQHRDLAHQTLGQFGLHADADLGLMQHDQSLAELTGRAFIAFHKYIAAETPDIVIAQGDTTTVMVAAVTSFYRGIPFAHVEAGLRTGELCNPFPEEFNRIVAGRVTNLHFSPTERAADSLKREGVDRRNVFVTGNTSIDNLVEYAGQLNISAHTPTGSDRLVLLTCHRRESFGRPMQSAFLSIRRLLDTHRNLRLIYPVHPNPNVRRLAEEVLGDVDRVRLIDPLEYFEFIAAMRAADLIISDSGGVQEEAPWLGKPVLVLRDETERPEAIEQGVAKLVGADGSKLFDLANHLLTDHVAYSAMASGASPYGDGKAARRIRQRLQMFFGLSVDDGLLSEFCALVPPADLRGNADSVKTMATT